ncbi:MAG: diphthine--ammonia ligase [Saprospiraceae bacterium]
MTEKLKTYLNWSSGKDAALALYHLQKNNQLEVDRLVTTINTHFDRVTMHGLQRQLLEEQAAAIGLPLDTIELPQSPTMEAYDLILQKEMQSFVEAGYTHCGFGDIFLEDLRQYRETQLAQVNLQGIFPLWKRDTKLLLEEFLALGFRAVVLCLNAQLLDESFLGREIDANFMKDLPAGVDPCGENGEFHTFCFDGPIFNYPVEFELGEKVFRSYPQPKQADNSAVQEMGFWFCDLIPK